MFLADPHREVFRDLQSGETTFKLLLSPEFPTVAGSSYFFRFEAIDYCGNTASSTSPTITINRPPQSGTVFVEPVDGYALNTTFLITAPGWTDPESLGSIDDGVLTYTFIYKVGDSSPQTLKSQEGVSSYETQLGAGEGDNCTVHIAVVVSDEQNGRATSVWKQLSVCRPVINTAQQLSRTEDMIQGGLKEISNPREVFKVAKLISNDMNTGTSSFAGVADDFSGGDSATAQCACVSENTRECVLSGVRDMRREKCICNEGFGGAQCHLSALQLVRIKEQRKEILAIALNFSSKMEITSSAVDSQAQFLSEVSDPSQMDEEASLLSLGYAADLASQAELSKISMTAGTRDSLAILVNTQLVDNIDRNTGAFFSNTTDTTVITRARRGIQVLSNVLGATSASMEIGENPTLIQTPLFLASTSVVSPADVAGSSVFLDASANSSMIVLSNETLSGIQMDSSPLSTQLVVMEEDPYGAGVATSKIVEFSLRSTNGSLSIHNLSEPIEITIPALTTPVEPPGDWNQSVANETIVVACHYAGQNISITNCSLGTPFNYTCKTPFPAEMICPKLIWVQSCVYFDNDLKNWTTFGLSTYQQKDGSIVCQTTHLTPFTTKFTSSLAAFDDVLAAPLSKQVNNADDLFNLVSSNFIMILAMFVLISLFIISCVLVQRRDALDAWKHKVRRQDRIKSLWAASHGILSVDVLELDVSSSSWWKLFTSSLAVYHPVLGIWLTHSLLVTRPQRVMILMVVLLVNMFVSALFYRSRYGGSSDSTPDFVEIAFFGAISALLNVPVVALFDGLYVYAGASYVNSKRYELIATEMLKNDPDAARKLDTSIDSVREARETLRIVDGAVRNLQLLCSKAMTTMALSRPSSALFILNQSEFNDMHDKLHQMRRLQKKYQDLIKTLEQETREKVESKLLEMNRGLRDKHRRRHPRCCEPCLCLHRLCILRRQRKLLESQMTDRPLTESEKIIHNVVDEHNFFLRKLFHLNKSIRNPDMQPNPQGLWIRTIIDTAAFLLVLFCAYFIVSFGFAYGQALAVAWLKNFLFSIAIEFIIVDPILILMQFVAVPKLVACTIFGHVDLIEGGHHRHHINPLMSGTRHALGPFGKQAFALGVTSVEHIGNVAWRARH